MTANEPIHDYEPRLVRSRRNIKLLRNGEVTLHFRSFKRHGLSIARVSKIR